MKKFVIVTGAGSGIGKSLCEDLLKKKFQPIAMGRRENLLKEASEYFLATDISNDSCSEQIRSYLSSLTSDGEIVGLINNAGIYKPESFLENDLDTWRTQFETNLYGAIRVTSASLNFLKKSSGSILNISSTLGIRPIQNTSAYSASKAAMNNWTLSLAIELAEFNINVNAICPGIIETPIHDFNKTKDKELRSQLDNMQPLKRVGQPRDVSSLAVHLISTESSWTTGGIFNVDGGMLLKS